MISNLLAQNNIETWQIVTGVVVVSVFLILVGAILAILKCYRKVEQGQAIIRNGMGGTKVSFGGMVVLPIIHRYELMDISVKRIEIDRNGEEGLICKDNIRADIKVAFFIRVNKEVSHVERVAQFLGCQRASQESALVALYEPKFSEALKSVGKQFDFVELYEAREQFREQIIKIIGTDLNGYLLDDAAIDYLEQTPLEALNPNNVLDAEGIKKITDLTAREQVRANFIRRDKEKTITKQDVEAREAILELEKQQAAAEEKQTREISEIRSRQRAEAEIVAQQERKRSETARISTEEEVQVAEENKNRSIIVASKAKERTDKVETERVERDRMLEATERERVVTLADIAKEKAVEVEKKLIQDVIRERVMVQRAVVEEEEKIKDTHEFATAERSKKVAITKAEEEAEQALVKEVRAAEAEKQAAERHAEVIIITAEAERSAAEKQTDAKKMLAEATKAETAAPGLGEVEVTLKRAEALEKEGTAEATVLELKFAADAKGITQKAEAMKLFDGVGREHEEFKLQLNKQKDVELAAINVQKDIAKAQAEMVGDALKSARIDIVGGDNKFFESIVNSITAGKQVDRLVNNSAVLGDIKQTFFTGDPDHFRLQLREFIDRFGIGSEDIKNLSVAGLLGIMMSKTDDGGLQNQLTRLLSSARQSGVADEKASAVISAKAKA